MADHDDKSVSEKRRRLFKALSAAPVVMTLRPGEALANASSLQCAATARALRLPEYIESDCLSLGDACEDLGSNRYQVDGGLYRGITYWFWGDRQPSTPFPLPLEVGPVIVQMPTGEYLDRAGNVAPTHPGLSFVTDTSTTPPTLKIYLGSNTTPRFAILGKFGLAAEVYTTAGDENTPEDRLLSFQGVHPQPKLGEFGPDPGDPQPMNGSCMHSFDMATGVQIFNNT
jgi:hypothetical protein